MKVLEEDGLDLTGHTSDTVEKYANDAFDIVVTVCDNARERCPYFPAPEVIHRNFPDPANARGTEAKIMEQFRRVRDEIKAWSQAFVAEKL